MNILNTPMHTLTIGDYLLINAGWWITCVIVYRAGLRRGRRDKDAPC